MTTVLFSILISIAFSSSGNANTKDNVASPGASSSPNFDSFFTPNTATANSDVEKEFQCIRLRTDDKQEMIKRADAEKIIQKIGPHLQQGFKDEGFSPFERAMFYAQALEETGGFSQIAETTSFAAVGDNPIGQLSAEAVQDEKFKARNGAKRSINFGEYRGRALLHISRCDNYISIAHYLRQKYAGQTPVWKSDWGITDNGNVKKAKPTRKSKGKGKDKGKDKGTEKPDVKKLGTVCTEEEMKQFRKEYADKYGSDPNIYGALEQPVRFGMLGGEFEDPASKRKMDSEKFMVDASIAYWRGRCGNVVKAMSDKATAMSYEPCKTLESNDYLTRAVQCLTRCIKGTTQGWERRHAWAQRALLCAR